MPRQLRVQYEGAIYHVTVRGNGLQNVFLARNDRRYLLRRLENSTDGLDVRLYLFCVMSNHFHLVLETPRANLNRFMQSLLTGYGVYYNRIHRKAGHVTQGRYDARLVEGDEYLLKLSRYVHLNPIKVKSKEGLTLKERRSLLRSYAWSSYPGYAGLGGRLGFVDYDPMLSLMEGKKSERVLKYRAYVEDGIDGTDENFLGELERSPRSIGGERFRGWVDEEYAQLLEQMGSKEDVSFRRERDAISPHAVVEAVAKAAKMRKADVVGQRRDSMVKGVAAWLLCKHAGLTRRKVAAIIGLKGGSGVTYQLRKVEDAMRSDKKLQTLIYRIEKNLKVRK